jgi:hypothetical protein
MKFSVRIADLSFFVPTPEPPKYEAEGLTTQPLHSVLNSKTGALVNTGILILQSGRLSLLAVSCIICHKKATLTMSK